MKFSKFLLASVVGIVAAQQEEEDAAPAADLSPEEQEFVACLDTCEGDDCTRCFVIPNPNREDVAATNDCVENCLGQGLDHQGNIDCHVSCFRDFTATGGELPEEGGSSSSSGDDDDEDSEGSDSEGSGKSREDLEAQAEWGDDEEDNDDDGEIDEEDEQEAAEEAQAELDAADERKSDGIDNDDDGEVDEDDEGDIEEAVAEDSDSSSSMVAVSAVAALSLVFA